MEFLTAINSSICLAFMMLLFIIGMMFDSLRIGTEPVASGLLAAEGYYQQVQIVPRKYCVSFWVVDLRFSRDILRRFSMVLDGVCKRLGKNIYQYHQYL